MPFPAFPRPAVPRLALISALLLPTLPACTPPARAPATVSEAEICKSLIRVVDQAAARFEGLKGTQVVAANVNQWSVPPVFPDSDCNVYEWGGGRTTFGCDWADTDQTSAAQTYAENAARLRACLGPAWKEQKQSGLTGQASLFSRSSDTTHVVLRYFKPRGPFARNWATSLTVGDNVTPDAR